MSRKLIFGVSVATLLCALPALADELNHAYLVHAVPKRQRGGALS